jgi:2-polyprenyl-6-methoxyphenol hydroxylase-like FAD-dependent oxidoreductase
MDAATDVLVVGGGLAGLAFADYLGRHGHEPTIVERREDWSDGGYGIGLWADGRSVLADLGRLSAVREAATDPREVAVRASDDGVLARLSVPEDRSLLFAVHRSELHAALREDVPESWLRMGTEPTRMEETDGGVDVTFDDGTTETFDIVVGADGVHSAVREACFTDWTVREHDTYVWSLWPERSVDLGADMVSVWGPGSEGFVARIGDRVGFNLAARHERLPTGPARETLRGHAEAIGWKLPDLLDGAEDPFFDRIRDVVCQNWHTDRVVLLGDAAHAVHPISGMGASLALQDARVLAQELLTSDGEAPFRRAFERFERRRRPDAKRVRRAARLEASVTFLDSPMLRTVRNELIKRTPVFEWFLRRELRETA